MPGPSTYALGNLSGQWILNLTLTPASVTSAGGNEQTFTCSGARLGDYVYVNKPTSQNGLVIGNCRVSANNVVAISFSNASAATITPTAGEVYTVYLCRYENYALASSAPSAIVGNT